MEIYKGDIVVVNFEPAKGSEQGGTRPALVIQNNIGNKFAPTTIVAPITSRKFIKRYPTNVSLSSEDSGLKQDSTILLNQIRTIDKARIKKCLRRLDNFIMAQVDRAIKISLGIN